jgi:tetrahydromethanopterin S-methyltransferase subunit E
MTSNDLLALHVLALTAAAAAAAAAAGDVEATLQSLSSGCEQRLLCEQRAPFLLE